MSGTAAKLQKELDSSKADQRDIKKKLSRIESEATLLSRSRGDSSVSEGRCKHQVPIDNLMAELPSTCTYIHLMGCRLVLALVGRLSTVLFSFSSVQFSLVQFSLVQFSSSFVQFCLAVLFAVEFGLFLFY